MHRYYNSYYLGRDFKLANILKHDGFIKIADFGFSKLLGNESLANTMLGSPLNMAPEVLSNVRPIFGPSELVFMSYSLVVLPTQLVI